MVSHVLGSRASEREIVTTEQVQLGIEVRVQLYVGKVLGIPLLVTTCCDNSGVSVGFLPLGFSPFVNKSLCYLFSVA